MGYNYSMHDKSSQAKAIVRQREREEELLKTERNKSDLSKKPLVSFPDDKATTLKDISNGRNSYWFKESESIKLENLTLFQLKQEGLISYDIKTEEKDGVIEHFFNNVAITEHEDSNSK